MKKKWLRRIRGAIGIGLTWAVGWAPIGALAGWVTAQIFGFPLGVVTVNYAQLFGVLGFMGGAIFSSVLSLTESRHSFHQLSLPRFVGWGALGGFLLGGLAVTAGVLGSGLSVLGAVIAGGSTVLGAGSAAGTLLIARAADDQELLREGQDVVHTGLSEEEARQLMGRPD